MSAVSETDSYQEIGEYWDTHDLGDIWEQTKPASFEVEIQSEAIYYAVEPNLATQISDIARARHLIREALKPLAARKFE